MDCRHGGLGCHRDESCKETAEKGVAPETPPGRPVRRCCDFATHADGGLARLDWHEVHWIDHLYLRCQMVICVYHIAEGSGLWPGE